MYVNLCGRIAECAVCAWGAGLELLLIEVLRVGGGLMSVRYVLILCTQVRSKHVLELETKF